MIHKEFMSKRELKAYEKLENDCSLWNTEFEIGETVKLIKDDGSFDEDIIVNRFSIMGGHTVMAWLKNNGSYLATRVRKIGDH